MRVQTVCVYAVPVRRRSTLSLEEGHAVGVVGLVGGREEFRRGGGEDLRRRMAESEYLSRPLCLSAFFSRTSFLYLSCRTGVWGTLAEERQGVVRNGRMGMNCSRSGRWR